MFSPNHQIGVGGLVLGREEKRHLMDVINASRLSYGPKTMEFEKRFAAHHDSKFAIFTNSGTSSLHISLQALKIMNKWADGDEVIVPAVTFVATANIVLHNRMKPIFVDVERDTYNIDPYRIEPSITQKTRAIIPVHLFGMPADMDPILGIAKKYSLKIIEDSCETMFAHYKGKSVGSFGEIGCFSTYVAHLLTTGVGGICITNNREIAIMIRSLMNHGRDSIYISIDDDKNKSEEKFKEIISKRFRFVYPGHSFRATELEAAIGLGQLEKKDWIINRRREIANKYIDGLKDLEDYIQLPRIPSDREHNFMMFPIVMKKEEKTNIVNYLEKNFIETRDMLPLINQPFYIEMFGNLEDKFPVAKWINHNGFYIGCHPYLSDEEVDYVIMTIWRYFGR